ncbi:MAG TPA: hypothetical protein RMG48_12250 [Myxococcales bacterium LLY-WYZ-16_1]|nr:hypothetical protein [Myxococcales bacterium LLY-WYZ-16_1]
MTGLDYVERLRRLRVVAEITATESEPAFVPRSVPALRRAPAAAGAETEPACRAERALKPRTTNPIARLFETIRRWLVIFSRR